MYISPEITFGLLMLLQEAYSLPLTNHGGPTEAFAFSTNHLLPLEEQRSSPGIRSYREKKSPSYPLPQFLVPHHQLHVIPLRRPILHQNNNILVLTPTNVTTTQLVPILVPIRNHLVPTAQRFVPVHQNHVVNVQNVFLQDLSVIPLHQAHLHEQNLQRARAKEVEDEEPMNQYRMYYGGFGNGLYFGGHGAGHGFYAYG